MPSRRTPPWEKKKPSDSASKTKSKARTKLSPANVAWAKARAKKAGRRYPNLVDNMAATRRQKTKTDRAKTRSRP